MPKHNNVVPNAHFRKDWDRRVKMWFNQPGRAHRRALARKVKAARMAPRPTEFLRPTVACPTRRYNGRLRIGRGFSAEEIKAAGVSIQKARTLGVVVDHRRVNKSEESLKRNAERVKKYLENLIVFPHRAAKPKKGDSSAEACKAAKQHVGEVYPVEHDHTVQRMDLSKVPAGSVFATLQAAQGNQKFLSRRKMRREKRAKDSAAAEKKASKTAAK